MPVRAAPASGVASALPPAMPVWAVPVFPSSLMLCLRLSPLRSGSPRSPHSKLKIPPPGGSLSPSTFDVRCSMFDVRRSMFDVRRSTFDVRRSTFDVRRSTFDVRRSTFDVRRSTFDVRRSTFDVRRSTFDVRRSTFDVRRSSLFPTLPPLRSGHASQASRISAPLQAASALPPAMPVWAVPVFPSSLMLTPHSAH